MNDELALPQLKSQLKSDHCGIEILLYYSHVIHHLQLKSDHCGIEMTKLFFMLTMRLKLKSDHCGIEIYYSKEENIMTNYIKIRPLWDRNEIIPGETVFHETH